MLIIASSLIFFLAKLLFSETDRGVSQLHDRSSNKATRESFAATKLRESISIFKNKEHTITELRLEIEFRIMFFFWSDASAETNSHRSGQYDKLDMTFVSHFLGQVPSPIYDSIIA